MDRRRWKLSTETLLNLVQTAAIVTGILFGLRELAELRQSRELEATLRMVDVYQDEANSAALVRLTELPTNLPEEEFNRQVGEDLPPILSLAGMWESLGILVHRGDVSLSLVDEFFGGPIIITWEKMARYTADARKHSGPQTFEWFQWLAERLQEHRKRPETAPAYELYRDWRP